MRAYASSIRDEDLEVKHLPSGRVATGWMATKLRPLVVMAEPLTTWTPEQMGVWLARRDCMFYRACPLCASDTVVAPDVPLPGLDISHDYDCPVNDELFITLYQ